MTVTLENYDALKAFWIQLLSWAMPEWTNLTLEQGNPVRTLEMFEQHSKAIARNSLQSGIGDLLEMTQSLTIDEVRKIDDALIEIGLQTLTSVRLMFWKRIRSMLERGVVRSQSEYYALRNVVEGMTGDDQHKAWSILGAFELKDMKI